MLVKSTILVLASFKEYGLMEEGQYLPNDR